MIKQELVKRIKDYFNLNIYETKVWLALLSKGIASAGEIATISGVPRSRTYDVLESLEKRGFAITKIGKPAKYIAVKPAEVIEKMKSLVMQESYDRVATLSNVKTTTEYSELEKLHTSGISPIKTSDITGSVKGRSNIANKIRDLIQGAEKEVTILTSVIDFEDKARIVLPALEEAVKKNIKIKLAISGPVEKIKKFKMKPSLKLIPSEHSSRLYIADKKEVLFMITPDHSDEDVGVWLNSPFFAQSLTSMLDKGLLQNAQIFR